MVNNPLLLGISGWNVGRQLTQRAQEFILALLLTCCYGTGQAVLSASVSPSVQQRSKCLICLKARGENWRFLVRGGWRWCLWFLCQTPRNFRFRQCRVGHSRPSYLLISFINCSHERHFVQVRGKVESTQVSWREHRSPGTPKAQVGHWRLCSGMWFKWLITGRELSL